MFGHEEEHLEEIPVPGGSLEPFSGHLPLAHNQPSFRLTEKSHLRHRIQGGIS
jgi:hypothetical protein